MLFYISESEHKLSGEDQSHLTRFLEDLLMGGVNSNLQTKSLYNF